MNAWRRIASLASAYRPGTAMPRGGRRSVTDLPSLDLSLTSRGFELVRAVEWGMALVIAGALASAGWFWWDTRAVERDALRYEQAKVRVLENSRHFVEQARLAGLNVSEARINALPREVAFANQLLAKRAFSWTRFLSDLEEAVPARVSISSVTLNFKDNTITLNGAAVTLKDLTALVASLEHHPAFKEVVLSQHRLQEDGTDHGTMVVRKERARTIDFSLSVAYRPPA